MTDDAKHKHSLPKWTKQKNPWGLDMVMRVAKVPYARNVENSPGVLFDVCDGAPSCWNVNGLFLKCFFASSSAGVKISSMYELAFTFAP